MNIKIHAKAYRSQCSSYNLYFILFIKQARTLVTILDLLKRRGGLVSSYFQYLYQNQLLMLYVQHVFKTKFTSNLLI